jgi:hypothetical protein
VLYYSTEEGRTDLYEVKRGRVSQRHFYDVIATGAIFPSISHKSFSNYKHAYHQIIKERSYIDDIAIVTRLQPTN